MDIVNVNKKIITRDEQCGRRRDACCSRFIRIVILSWRRRQQPRAMNVYNYQTRKRKTAVTAKRAVPRALLTARDFCGAAPSYPPLPRPRGLVAQTSAGPEPPRRASTLSGACRSSCVTPHAFPISPRDDMSYETIVSYDHRSIWSIRRRRTRGPKTIRVVGGGRRRRRYGPTRDLPLALVVRPSSPGTTRGRWRWRRKRRPAGRTCESPDCNRDDFSTQANQSVRFSRIGDSARRRTNNNIVTSSSRPYGKRRKHHPLPGKMHDGARR